jgi:hypothetical protein
MFVIHHDKDDENFEDKQTPTLGEKFDEPEYMRVREEQMSQQLAEKQKRDLEDYIKRTQMLAGNEPRVNGEKIYNEIRLEDMPFMMANNMKKGAGPQMIDNGRDERDHEDDRDDRDDRDERDERDESRSQSSCDSSEADGQMSHSQMCENQEGEYEMDNLHDATRNGDDIIHQRHHTSDLQKDNHFQMQQNRSSTNRQSKSLIESNMQITLQDAHNLNKSPSQNLQKRNGSPHSIQKQTSQNFSIHGSSPREDTNSH